MSKVPSKVGVLLFPGFEPLDVFGPVEAFHTISHQSTKIDLVWIGPTLDPVSTAPKEIVMTTVGSTVDTRVVPTHTYDNPPEDLEVLLVPGGVGTRVQVPTSDAAVAFVKKTYPKLKYLITVCTGAGIAARAGVLDGKRATTNKYVWKTTTMTRPEVNWVRTARYVVDGNCWTSGGVSAGIDVTLAWMASVYGQEAARDAANHMEYEWRDDRNWDPFAYMFSDSEGA
ncbi:class I glutamine amidotransferase-like protein [Lentinus tigrinus ALCF2SS1-7]|uniref:Class I glutamine amidotransferase-like protein n=1 Tax=Lentinus tigrinus ALCF2SS1-6 TaxID=1328759 RepID=A0A5C2RPG2_9APHY|nr:class I glutamine amidotransferase-like protein [Lentinus tigrinus ALCF2SS1-6]RPD69660.1 class I glutamine amidotransferase-like protein [Lentinus tigrinus ALCF2SS1-7]